MRTAIVFATKTGATEVYAQRLQQELQECDLFDINEQAPNIQGYDRVILGCGLRIGKAYKQMRKFMQKNVGILAEKPLWIYFCGIDEEGFPKVPEANIPEELQQAARDIVLLKGRQPFDKASEVESWFDEEGFQRFCQQIRDA